MKRKLKFLDLFAGAGGLSEGFIQAGFSSVGHVEVDKSACYTLKTRNVFHWLNKNNRQERYNDYLYGRISRTQLYNLVPKREISSIINAEINEVSLPGIFGQIDNFLNGEPLDVIIGGPPCQAYSLVGRSRDKNRMRGDQRNYLYIFYAEFLKKYRPRFFIFENVTGLLSATSTDGTRYFDNMLSLFRKAGYETEYKILSAEEFGILQSRKRIVLVGKRGTDTGFFPEPVPWHPRVQVREILQDLPPLQAGSGSIQPCQLLRYEGEYLYKANIKKDNSPVTWHISRPHTEQDLEIYQIAANKWNIYKERLNYNELPDRLKTHQNRSSFQDRYKIVAADLPHSHTIVAHISKDGHYYIHPDIHQNRSLTPREAARLQTFPDDYFFESVSEPPGRTPVFQQIGNAVPVLLSKKIAKKLKELF